MKQKKQGKSSKTSSLQLFWQTGVRAQAIILCALAMLLYVQSLRYGYVVDDIIVLSENRFVQQGIAGIPDIVSKSTFAGHEKAAEKVDALSGGRYRPLSLVVFAIGWSLWGNNAMMFHLINVVGYGVLALVLLWTLRLLAEGHEFTRSRPFVPFAVALLFVAHPIHTEVVCNIKSFDEILCLSLSLGSLYYFVSYYRTQKIAFLAASCGLILLAFFAKESAITFLFLLPLSVYVFGDTTPSAQEVSGTDWKRLLVAWLTVVAVAIVFLLIRTQIVGFIDNRKADVIFDNPFLRSTVSEKYATAVMVLGRYLISAVYPFVMAFDYSYNAIPITNWSDWRVLASLVAHLLLVGYAARGILRKQIPAFGLWWYLATISIVSNLVFEIGALMGDRFLFIPSLGMAFVLVYGVVVFVESRTAIAQERLRYALVLTSLIAGVYVLRTLTRNPVWESNETLAVSNIESAPGCVRNRRVYSSALMEKAGKSTNAQEQQQYLAEAYKQLWACMAIDPTCDPNVQFRFGQYFSIFVRNEDSAVYYYKWAVDLDSTVDGYKFYYTLNRGNIDLSAKRWDSAFAWYQKALSYNIQIEQPLINIGLVYYNKGMLDSAISYFERSKNANPAFENAQRAYAAAVQEREQRQQQQR